jgi:2-keto-4-pentenoate hydratase/2-oxohepta-3-ene-1,7-dioic acid hydratase in catechol pathway
MKFVTFARGGAHAVGVWLEGPNAKDGAVLDLRLAAELAGETLEAPDMITFIEGGEAAWAVAKKLAASPPADALYPAAGVTLLAPIPRPRKNVFCVGRNYMEHVQEGDRMFNRDPSIPTVPNFFSKTPTTVVGPGADVLYPAKVTQAFDYEIELGVIIGKGGKDITRENAMQHVFGYTIINDVTARDLQRSHVQWFKGKTLDTTCPMGPWIVDADEIGDPKTMELTFLLNGEQRQHASTAQMIFDVPAILESLSAGLTLEPGDVIASGTPSGVGFGMEPKGLMKGGDVMECRISKIGVLKNTVREV